MFEKAIESVDESPEGSNEATEEASSYGVTAKS